MARLLWMILFLSSCGEERDVSGPLQAYIVNSSENGYQLSAVTIKTLQSAKNVVGDYAVVKGGAVLDLLQDVEEIVASSDPDAIYQDRGSNVHLDYQISGDVIYPRSFSSAAALAIYYNYERTFEYWRDNLGISLDTFGVTSIYNDPILFHAWRGNVFI